MPQIQRLAPALVCALALLASCAEVAPPVLSPAWPDKSAPYDHVHRTWTRHGRVQNNFQRVIDVYATFKSPAWRAAYVERKARKSRLTASDVQTLRAAQREAAAGDYEVHLLVSTWDFRENNLHNGPKSPWQITLEDDRGNQVSPSYIRRDRRPRWVLRAEYPDMGDFTTAYVARFPRTIDVLREDASHFTLRIAGPRGAAVMTWKNGKSGT